MILPIVGYGHDSLRRENKNIDKDYPELEQLLANMFETMYNAHGVGLAAPQVNIPIRLFVVDGEPLAESYEEEADELTGFKQVFINPEILEEEGTPWKFEEGCLSIPDIREEVSRKETIRIKFLDENFVEHEKVFSGVSARIIQHEYDHVEGVLFTDHISNMRRRLLKTRLNKITLGKIPLSYPMKFPKQKG